MDSFVGEVRAFGFNYAPAEWAFCDGKQVLISQWQALYAVIGRTFGGDGRTYFNLPNLKGLVVMGAGTGPGLTSRNVGDVVGESSTTLTVNQIPAHSHPLNAGQESPPPSGANLTATPSVNTLMTRKVRQTPDGKLTISKSFSVTPGSSQQEVVLHRETIGVAGEGGSHENRQPYLALNYCISLNGEWPPHPS